MSFRRDLVYLLQFIIHIIQSPVNIIRNIIYNIAMDNMFYIIENNRL